MASRWEFRLGLASSPPNGRFTKIHCKYSGSLSRAPFVEAIVEGAVGGMTRRLIGHAVGARAFA